MRLVDLEPSWVSGSYERDGMLYTSTDPTTQDGQRYLELNPQYHVDPLFPRGREKMALMFRCPVHSPDPCEYSWLMIPFHNPLDGGPKTREGQGRKRDQWWTVVGDSFENLTVTPSIKFPDEGPEHWHGFVTNGQVA